MSGVTDRTAGASPRTGDACLSDLALDRLVVGGEATTAQRDHLETCERCGQRLALFEGGVDESEHAVASALGAARQRVTEAGAAPPARSWWGRGLPRLALAGATLAALTLVLLWALEPGDQPAGEPAFDDTLRIKGTTMRFFVQRGEEVVPGVSGDVYRPGDSLRFAVSNDAPKYFFLVGVEESGLVSAYVPFDGDTSLRLTPGIDQPMPGSLVLDDSPQTEYFVGLFTDTPLAFDDIVEELEAARARHGSWEGGLRELDLPGQHRWVVVNKEAP